MKLRPVVLALCASLALAAPAAWAQARKPGERKTPTKEAPAKKKEKGAESAPASWYALRVTRGDTGVIVTNLWSAGRSMRAEAVLSGVPIVQLVSGEWYYVIDGLRQAGIAVRRSPKALAADLGRDAGRPFGNEAADLKARGAELVREEEVGGRKARVLRLTDEMGRHEVWVTDDASALPIRIDSTDRSSGVHVVTDYVDWLSHMELPAPFFEPDPRIQLERLEYADYLERSSRGHVGPAPVLFGDLLHGP
ncbi:MAG: hypothetical protein OZ948_04765 [Deltaproteobacteria bacterium]|nr:hypothetical protein [Deltaproteobacteria bacterium]